MPSSLQGSSRDFCSIAFNEASCKHRQRSPMECKKGQIVTVMAMRLTSKCAVRKASPYAAFTISDTSAPKRWCTTQVPSWKQWSLGSRAWAGHKNQTSSPQHGIPDAVETRLVACMLPESMAHCKVRLP